MVLTILRKWPFNRGRDRFFRMLPQSCIDNLNEIPNPVELKNGTNIFVCQNDFLSLWYKCYGEYETVTSQLIRKYVKPETVFLDIGANLGYFSLEVAHSIGADVISFEPNPRIADLFYKSINTNDLNAKITLWRVALSNAHNTATFFENSENLGASSLVPNSSQSHAVSYEVPVKKLDEFKSFQSHFVSLNKNVSVVKMDVEGAEALVLDGMKELIVQHQPVFIIELLDKQLKLFDSSKAAVIEYLNMLGYKLELEFDGNGLFIFNH